MVVAPVFIGVSTNSAAVRNGRNGIPQAIFAGFILPGSAMLMATFGIVAGSMQTDSAVARFARSADGGALFFAWLLIASGGIAAMRYLVGDSTGRSILWGVLATIASTALFIANVFLDLILLIGTSGIGFFIEVLLIPVWIWLIVRWARRGRVQIVGRPGMYEPYPAFPGVPPPPPTPTGSGDAARSPHELEPPSISPAPRIEYPYVHQDPDTPPDPYTQQDPYG